MVRNNILQKNLAPEAKMQSWDNVFGLLHYDVADILSKDALDGECDGVHHVLEKVVLYVVFVEPIMADELALAV